jgi:Rrf2 family transcriptional regulator, nitric oxide-sensitive transcriptional repressor
VHMKLHTDYALRMLIFLALRRDRPCTVNDVAESYGLSRNHLLKVALNLRKLGLISTARGRTGGIRLLLAPEQINIGVLVRHVEDDFALVECLGAGECGCIISPACRLRGMVREALNAYLAVFDKYSLADLVANGEALRMLFGVAVPGGKHGDATA